MTTNLRVFSSVHWVVVADTQRNPRGKTLQDRMFLGPPGVPWVKDERGYLFAIADGCGGHEGGGMAARIAIEALEGYYEDEWETTKSPEDYIHELLTKANETIRERQRQNPAFRTMATTITALLLFKDLAHVIHAGDSRLYLMQGSELKQVTQDDESGNVLTRCLNGSMSCPLTQDVFQLTPDHCLFLLGTDGLHRYVAHEKIQAACLQWGKTPEKLVPALIQLAVEAGSNDDITVIILKKTGEHP